MKKFFAGCCTVVASALCHSLQRHTFGQHDRMHMRSRFVFHAGRIASGALMTALLPIVLLSCQQNNTMSGIQPHAFRLKPGEDLKEGITRYVQQHQIKAGWISTCVGSVTQYQIRLANQPGSSTGNGHFEIVSLTGTVSINGSHLHLAVSDSTGRTIGGHLLEGNKVYTTAEIVLLSTDAFEFIREKDGTTPWEELQVKKRVDN